MAEGALYIKYTSWADQEGKPPLLCRVLVPFFREAGICSGTPLGAEDDVQGEAVRISSAPCQGSGEEELSGTQLNIQDGQAAQVSQEYASRHSFLSMYSIYIDKVVLLMGSLTLKTTMLLAVCLSFVLF